MEDPDDKTMVYDGDFGFNEAGVATVLLHSPKSTPKFARKKMEQLFLQKVANREMDKDVT